MTMSQVGNSSVDFHLPINKNETTHSFHMTHIHDRAVINVRNVGEAD